MGWILSTHLFLTISCYVDVKERKKERKGSWKAGHQLHNSKIEVIAIVW